MIDDAMHDYVIDYYIWSLKWSNLHTVFWKRDGPRDDRNTSGFFPSMYCMNWASLFDYAQLSINSRETFVQKLWLPLWRLRWWITIYFVFKFIYFFLYLYNKYRTYFFKISRKIQKPANVWTANVSPTTVVRNVHLLIFGQLKLVKVVYFRVKSHVSTLRTKISKTWCSC